jgi:DNA repair photolyase
MFPSEDYKEFKSFYKSIDNRKYNTWCRYTKRLDTYGCGCEHNCKYCYSRSLLDFRGLFYPQKPSIANIYKIKNRIKRLDRYETIKLGGMTDCFQSIEKKERITFQTIILLNYFKISYLIVTKSDLVANDEYLNIYDKNLAHFQITITSTDDKRALEYENAPLVSKRIQSIEKLYSLGFDVCLRLSPYFVENVDLNILANIKCNKILVEFLKVNPFIKRVFDIDYSLYSLKYGGYEHLPLENKIELVNKIKGFDQLCVGEYVRDHYEYFRDNVNCNKEDCCNLNERKHIIYIQKSLFE